MPGGLGNSLFKAKKKKAEAARSNYRHAVEQAKANAPDPNDAPALDARGSTGEHEKEKKLTSIWQTSNMDDFLAIASERENGFAAERNVRVVVEGQVHVVTDEKIAPLSDATRDWFALSDNLKIPTRPPWTFDMSAEEIQGNEKRAFLDWRRGLAQIEEKEQITLTPYEKNLEVWRQLWRVVERSDVVLEIVDARNPLTFRSDHFEKYVREHKNTQKVKKDVILLLNKADLLTETQRKLWAEYLTARGFKFFFFSAFENLQEQAETAKKLVEQGVNVEELNRKRAEEAAARWNAGEDDIEDIDEETLLMEEELIRLQEKVAGSAPKPESKKKRRQKNTFRGNAKVLDNPYDDAVFKKGVQAQQPTEVEQAASKKKEQVLLEKEKERDARAKSRLEELQPYDVLSPEALLDQLSLMREKMKVTDRSKPLVVGMVGYPNVGKSSTINAIIGSKKVVVSATPGKTKHFQTLTIPNERRVMVCDCPGLVFPSFAATRDTMIVDGVLPVDTVKDYVTPISVIAKRVPQVVFERLFKITVDRRLDVDESTNDADLLLNLVARRKNYMTEHDKPNRSKAAKEILKMYVDGGLIYVHPPPGYQAPSETKQMYELEAEAAREEEEKRNKSKHFDASEGISAAQRAADADLDDMEEEEEEVVDYDEDDDSEEWEDVDSASDARGLSDDEDEYLDGIQFAGMRKKRKVLEDDSKKPRTFLSTTGEDRVADPAVTGIAERKRLLLTESEAFNLQSNEHLLSNETTKRRVTKKRTNHQLEPDMTVMINEEGKKELLIDSDDGIVECEYAGPVVQRPKRPSKRQQRREEKRAGKATRKENLGGYDY